MLRRAHALARLAIFNEQRRLPLKRDEISKKGTYTAHNALSDARQMSSIVLGSKGRRFGDVLLIAQAILRKTFGMELVELQRSIIFEDDKDANKTDAVGMKKKGAFLPLCPILGIQSDLLLPQLRLRVQRHGYYAQF